MSAKGFDAAIVGGGPAGSTIAHRLAAGGLKVVIFDDSHPREKPCGGGISSGAREMFPELEDLVDQGKKGDQLRLISPAGRVTTVYGGGQTFAIERAILDDYLLRRAETAGCVHRAEKVCDVIHEDRGWNIVTDSRETVARLVIGADGVFSKVRRKLIGPIDRKHLAIGAHALLSGLNAPSAMLHFFGDRRGYAWVFNRRSNSSIGVGMPLTKCDNWKMILERFFSQQAKGHQMPAINAWCLPQAKGPGAFHQALAGDDWLLVGDAAGHVDPLTGEGIRYAMWGAQLAAKCILDGQVKRYDKVWRDNYLSHFERNAQLARVLENKWVLEGLLAAGRLPYIKNWLFDALAG